jgi:hypothetical protein
MCDKKVKSIPQKPSPVKPSKPSNQPIERFNEGVRKGKPVSERPKKDD